MTDGTRTYAVDDDMQRYVFRPSEDSPGQPQELGQGRPRHLQTDLERARRTTGRDDVGGAAERGSHTHSIWSTSMVARGGAGTVVAAIAALDRRQLHCKQYGPDEQSLVLPNSPVPHRTAGF